MKADAKTRSAVLAVLKEFSDSYARRDLKAFRAVFVPDRDLVVYGTGADEKRVGRAQIEVQAKRDWAQADAATVKFGWTSVSAVGAAAWVATDATFDVTAGGQQASLPVRITCVLERRARKWLIAQAHFSFPAVEQADGQSFPT